MRVKINGMNSMAVGMFMKYFFLVFGLIISRCLLGQSNYYVGKGGDTVFCEFKKVFPRSIRVKTEKEGTKTLSTDQVSAFTKDGVPFKAKKITNQKKNPFIFLPGDKEDRKYLYSDPNLVMISGKGITFFELEEFGGVSQYGRSITVTFYIENDSLGLTKVPYMKAIGGNTEQIDVINALYGYLSSNEAIEKKLSVNESWKTFNYKGIRKLVTGFMGKGFVE